MVSEDKRFIFVHIHKTGGTSVQKILSKYSEDIIRYKDPKNPEVFQVINSKHGFTKHAGLNHYNRLYNLEDYTVFTIIRNPWDRMLSYYFFDYKSKKINHKKLNKTINQYLGGSTLELITIEGKNGVPFIYPDMNFLRFENLQNDFYKICDKINIPREELPHLNKSKRDKNYQKYYNDENRELVYRKFIQDIQTFKYEF